MRFFPPYEEIEIDKPKERPTAKIVRERMEKGFQLDCENFARDRANVYGDMERAFKKVKG